MRTTTNPVQKMPTVTSQSYSPSVPLTVYRELAAELQAAQAMIDSLSNKNKELVKENQQLRQEIDKAVQAVLRLQKTVEAYETGGYNTPPRSSPDLRHLEPPTRSVNAPRPPQQQRVPRPSPPPSMPPMEPPVMSETIYVEHDERRYRYPKQSSSMEVSGWWLAIAILLIIVTAFGAGYMVVRPLLQQQNR